MVLCFPDDIGLTHSQGIGQATAVSFAKEGCTKIVIADRNSAGLKETSELISKVSKDVNVLISETDIASEQAVNTMIEQAVSEFGRIDYVLNGAGMSVTWTLMKFVWQCSC